MTRRIAVYSGSFNPPGVHHRAIAEALAGEFHEVIVVPSGPRADRLSNNDVEPVFRAALADIAFRGLPRTRVELFDLEQGTFTPTHALEARFSHEGEIWHAVGPNLTAGGAQGESVIHRTWQHGAELWEKLNFAVILPPGVFISASELPPRSRVVRLEEPLEGDTNFIREKIFHREPYRNYVPHAVAEYIERYGLYRARIPSRATRFSFKEPRALIVADERNPKAMEWAAQLEWCRSEWDPNCIIVIGGDGTMLHAIRQHWRRRVPFLGINAGHLGFLLNNASSIVDADFRAVDMTVRQLPLLYLELLRQDGTMESALAFNDAWIERVTSQSAWVELKVNDRVRLNKLVCDGLLVSTAAGSTAYARSMGTFPLLADTPGWLVVGSNVMNPPGWKSALLSTEATVEAASIGGEKRPVRAFIDGRAHGEVVAMRARLSRIATAELAFHSANDMAEKIALIQFPRTQEM